MARLHYVKKAMKDNPVAKKGEPYYWWKFRYGGKRYSKERPPGSALINSPFLRTAAEIGEEIAVMAPEDADHFETLRDDFAQRIRELGEEAQGSFDNLPEGLQQGPTGELLEGRSETCEEWASNIEGIEVEEPDDLDREDFKTDEEFEEAKEAARTEALEAAVAEVQNYEYEGE